MRFEPDAMTSPPTAAPHTAWHAQSADAVAHGLDSNVHTGLNASEVQSRLAAHGPNRLA